jgi:hypothetical protein
VPSDRRSDTMSISSISSSIFSVILTQTVMVEETHHRAQYPTDYIMESFSFGVCLGSCLSMGSSRSLSSHRKALAAKNKLKAAEARLTPISEDTSSAVIEQDGRELDSDVALNTELDQDWDDDDWDDEDEMILVAKKASTKSKKNLVSGKYCFGLETARALTVS